MQDPNKAENPAQLFAIMSADIAYLQNCIERRDNKGFFELLDRKPNYLNYVDQQGLSFLHHAIRTNNHRLINGLKKRIIAPVKKYILLLECTAEFIDESGKPVFHALFNRLHYDGDLTHQLPGTEVPNLDQLSDKVNAFNLLQHFPPPISSSFYFFRVHDAYQATQYVICVSRNSFRFSPLDYLNNPQFKRELPGYPGFEWKECSYYKNVPELKSQVLNKHIAYFNKAINAGYRVHYAIETLDEKEINLFYYYTTLLNRYVIGDGIYIPKVVLDYDTPLVTALLLRPSAARKRIILKLINVNAELDPPSTSLSPLTLLGANNDPEVIAACIMREIQNTNNTYMSTRLLYEVADLSIREDVVRLVATKCIEDSRGHLIFEIFKPIIMRQDVRLFETLICLLHDELWEKLFSNIREARPKDLLKVVFAETLRRKERDKAITLIYEGVDYILDVGDPELRRHVELSRAYASDDYSRFRRELIKDVRMVFPNFMYQRLDTWLTRQLDPELIGLVVYSYIHGCVNNALSNNLFYKGLYTVADEKGNTLSSVARGTNDVRFIMFALNLAIISKNYDQLKPLIEVIPTNVAIQPQFLSGLIGLAAAHHDVSIIIRFIGNLQEAAIVNVFKCFDDRTEAGQSAMKELVKSLMELTIRTRNLKYLGYLLKYNAFLFEASEAQRKEIYKIAEEKKQWPLINNLPLYLCNQGFEREFFEFIYRENLPTFFLNMRDSKNHAIRDILLSHDIHMLLKFLLAAVGSREWSFICHAITNNFFYRFPGIVDDLIDNIEQSNVIKLIFEHIQFQPRVRMLYLNKLAASIPVTHQKKAILLAFCRAAPLTTDDLESLSVEFVQNYLSHEFMPLIYEAFQTPAQKKSTRVVLPVELVKAENQVLEEINQLARLICEAETPEACHVKYIGAENRLVFCFNITISHATSTSVHHAQVPIIPHTLGAKYFDDEDSLHCHQLGSNGLFIYGIKLDGLGKIENKPTDHGKFSSLEEVRDVLLKRELQTFFFCCVNRFNPELYDFISFSAGATDSANLLSSHIDEEAGFSLTVSSNKIHLIFQDKENQNIIYMKNYLEKYITESANIQYAADSNILEIGISLPALIQTLRMRRVNYHGTLVFNAEGDVAMALRTGPNNQSMGFAGAGGHCCDAYQLALSILNELESEFGLRAKNKEALLTKMIIFSKNKQVGLAAIDLDDLELTPQAKFSANIYKLRFYPDPAEFLPTTAQFFSFATIRRYGIPLRNIDSLELYLAYQEQEINLEIRKLVKDEKINVSIGRSYDIISDNTPYKKRMPNKDFGLVTIAFPSSQLLRQFIYLLLFSRSWNLEVKIYDNTVELHNINPASLLMTIKTLELVNIDEEALQQLRTSWLNELPVENNLMTRLSRFNPHFEMSELKDEYLYLYFSHCLKKCAYDTIKWSIHHAQISGSLLLQAARENNLILFKLFYNLGCYELLKTDDERNIANNFINNNTISLMSHNAETDFTANPADLLQAVAAKNIKFLKDLFSLATPIPLGAKPGCRRELLRLALQDVTLLKALSLNQQCRSFLTQPTISESDNVHTEVAQRLLQLPSVEPRHTLFSQTIPYPGYTGVVLRSPQRHRGQNRP